jgi:hypothetical protein
MTLPHQPKQPLIACSRLVKATSPPRPPLSIRRHLLMLPPGQTLDEPERYTPTDNVLPTIVHPHSWATVVPGSVGTRMAAIRSTLSLPPFTLCHTASRYRVRVGGGSSHLSCRRRLATARPQVLRESQDYKNCWAACSPRLYSASRSSAVLSTVHYGDVFRCYRDIGAQT